MADGDRQPSEGWYPDPKNPDQLRYWDGSTWTDATSDSLVTPYTSSPAEAPKTGRGYLVAVDVWFGEVFQVIKKKWLAFLLLSIAIPAGLAIVLGGIGFAVAGDTVVEIFEEFGTVASDPSADPDAAFVDITSDDLLFVFGLVFILALIWWLAQAPFGLAARDQAYAAQAGEDRAIGTSIGLGLRRFLPYIGWNALLGLIVAGVVLAAGLLVAIGFAISQAVGVLLLVVLLLASVPAAIFVYVRLTFVGAAVVLNPGENPISASWNLTRNSFWGLLGRMVVLWLLSIPISIVTSILDGILFGLGSALAFPLQVLLGIFASIAMIGLYHQLKGPAKGNR